MIGNLGSLPEHWSQGVTQLNKTLEWMIDLLCENEKIIDVPAILALIFLAP